MKANSANASPERPSPELRPIARKSGTSASRAKPMALGIVQGLSGSPRRLGVGELLARARVVAVVVEHVEAQLAQLVVELVGERARLLPRFPERHELDV